MNEPLNNLIEALREELKQYGEMLALLDQEQDLVMHRQTNGIPPCVAAINAQADTLQVVRHEREQRRRHLARTLQLCEDIGFKELTSRLPSEYQPLIQALVQENKELLVRVQQRARQNHLLLSRMVELMQKLISSILPGTGPATYNEGGLVLAPGLPQQQLYDAIG
jgi:flagellar biosynthesis/type III secretory pathway chaperone